MLRSDIFGLDLELLEEKLKRKCTEVNLLEVELGLEKSKRIKVIEAFAKTSSIDSLTYLWHTYDPQHLPMSDWFQPSQSSFNLNRRPNSKDEKDYQTFFCNEILAQLPENHYIKVLDTHDCFYLDGLAPNISALHSDYGLDIHVINSVGDIKPRKTPTFAFQDAHKGQVLNYGIKILQHQRERYEVTNFLTDFYEILFIRVVKEEQKNGLQFTVHFSSLFQFDGEGSKYLRALLFEMPYHPEIGLNVRTSSLIAQTKTSKIFAVKKRNDLVLKIVHQKILLEREKKALEKLKGIIGIIQLLGQSKCALLLSPRAECSFNNSGLPVFNSSNDIILADFGSSAFIGEIDFYGGAPLFLVSERVLNSYGKIIDAHPKDDLHALIRSLYLLVNQSNLNETFLNIDDTNSVREYWEIYLKVSHGRPCIDIAMN
ncbi:6888_t:CDS:2 [Entrophospora sp. SA101]|nr:6888_t:CDS:2 [Entrophospora sp. SA101]CAJ0835759.1 10589_t:CDS:2 [Entrophospora sp. SA101]CAJ0908377.1 5970_t:CDS:2 [Entrophospora sp. SA101]